MVGFAIFLQDQLDGDWSRLWLLVSQVLVWHCDYFICSDQLWSSSSSDMTKCWHQLACQVVSITLDVSIFKPTWSLQRLVNDSLTKKTNNIPGWFLWSCWGQACWVGGWWRSWSKGELSWSSEAPPLPLLSLPTFYPVTIIRWQLSDLDPVTIVRWEAGEDWSASPSQFWNGQTLSLKLVSFTNPLLKWLNIIFCSYLCSWSVSPTQLPLSSEEHFYTEGSPSSWIVKIEEMSEHSWQWWVGKSFGGVTLLRYYTAWHWTTVQH